MISLLLAAKSLLWLAMIFPTLEFLISRCEHQFDVHQSPPAKVHRHTAIETHPVPARLADVLGLFVGKFGFPYHVFIAIITLNFELGGRDIWEIFGPSSLSVNLVFHYCTLRIREFLTKGSFMYGLYHY